jgi:hypothetical protein
MEKTRENLIDRILAILSRLKDNTLETMFTENIEIFGIEELHMMNDFLESGDDKHLALFLDKLSKESSEIKNEISQIEITSVKRENRAIEEQEKEKEAKETENILVF